MSTLGLKVLVVENEIGAADEAQQELRQAGHSVVACHEQHAPAFPCRGIADPSACPLRAQPVDVALVVRSGRRASPTVREEGARCALAHRVPLVVAGDAVLDPYDEFATRTLGRTYDVVTACELAATAPVEALSRRATEVLNDVAAESGTHSATAVVTRRDGRLVVRLLGAGVLAKDEQARAAVRIAMALRELDPFAAGIDVARGES